MDARCRIELLGRLRVMHGDREITPFRTQKTGALLGYLAYHLERTHPPEVLMDILWGGGHPRAKSQIGSSRRRRAASSWAGTSTCGSPQSSRRSRPVFSAQQACWQCPLLSGSAGRHRKPPARFGLRRRVRRARGHVDRREKLTPVPWSALAPSFKRTGAGSTLSASDTGP